MPSCATTATCRAATTLPLSGEQPNAQPCIIQRCAVLLVLCSRPASTAGVEAQSLQNPVQLLPHSCPWLAAVRAVSGSCATTAGWGACRRQKSARRRPSSCSTREPTSSRGHCREGFREASGSRLGAPQQRGAVRLQRSCGGDLPCGSNHRRVCLVGCGCGCGCSFQCSSCRRC